MVYRTIKVPPVPGSITVSKVEKVARALGHPYTVPISGRRTIRMAKKKRAKRRK